jgi:hypothetical protein
LTERPASKAEAENWLKDQMIAAKEWPDVRLLASSLHYTFPDFSHLEGLERQRLDLLHKRFHSKKVALKPKDWKKNDECLQILAIAAKVRSDLVEVSVAGIWTLGGKTDEALESVSGAVQTAVSTRKAQSHAEKRLLSTAAVPEQPRKCAKR